MLKLLTLLIFLSFFSYNTKSQNLPNKIKSEELKKEVFPIWKAFLRNYDNRDSGKILNNILIDKFKTIYQLDSTDKGVGDFLIDCYTYNKEYEKAIYWNKHQLLINDDSISKRTYFRSISYSFICLGNIDSSKFYLDKAFKIYKEQDYPNDHFDITNFIMFADSLYRQKDKEDLSILRKTQKQACEYSVEILKFIQPYLKDSKIYFYLNKPYNEETIEETIRERQNHCR
jgi:tetratricopeptide (TPR) repeat protein